MNASLSALLVLLLLSGSWALGRRRSRPFLRSTDAGAVAALNRAQIERLQDNTAAPAAAAPAAGEAAVSPSAQPMASARPSAAPRSVQAGPIACPSSSKVRLLVDCWGSRSREERLALLELARRQPQPVLLPLLRRALRDPDPQLVAAAASALQRYRGASSLPAALADPWRTGAAARSTSRSPSSRSAAFRG